MKARPPQPLAGALKNVLKNLSGKRPGEEEIGGLWARAAGEKAALHSRPVSFRKSVLVVNVDVSGWLYELTLRKKEILAELAKDLKGKKRVKDIRLRIGVVAHGEAKGREKAD